MENNKNEEVKTEETVNASAFEITHEMIENATVYIPLAQKQAFAELVAEDVTVPVETSVLSVQADHTLALPKQYEENCFLKKLYLAKFFLEEYLHVEASADGGFTPVDYDKFFASHPMNQLERYKNASESKEFKDKVFDILADFKELKKTVDTEIYKSLMRKNDSMERFLAGITVFSTPENVKLLTEELQKSAEQFSAIKENAAKGKKQTKELAEQLKPRAEEDKQA